MPDVYDELDVFGRPKSRVAGIPYVEPDDDLVALQNYVLNLEAKKAAIESGARVVRKPKEIVREGARLPGYVHEYNPAYTVAEQERLRDEQDPVRFMPIVRQGVSNVQAIMEEGPEKWDLIKDKTFGPRLPRQINKLGGVSYVAQPATFDERFYGPVPRTEMWPEKMARSGVTLPGDVVSGRVMTGPGLRATDFSDIPGAPNPLGPLIERTQDLAGLAMGGSIPELAARGVDRNALGSGFVPKEKIVDAAIRTDKGIFRGSTHATATVRAEDAGVNVSKLNLDNADGFLTSTGRFVSREEAAKIVDEAGQRTSNTPRLESGQVTYPFEKDLTQGSFGGNVPPSVARNIGRETMPEILARQRASEGYEAAIRDPETKKLYTGMWHEEVLDKIAKDEPDVIGHSRVNDRQIPGVGKALHIEEIGSQLHEKGAEKGYNKEKPPELVRAVHEAAAEYQKVVQTTHRNPQHPLFPQEQIAMDKLNAAEKLLKPYKEGVPDLPFRKTYVDLAVNRMLHEAATQGYDAVSWTPYELQKKNYGGDSNKEILPRIEALAKKYGGKVEKHKVEMEIDKDGKPVTEDVYHVKLTPEMKRIFGHDDFSFFPKQEAAGEAGKGFKLRSDSEAGAAIGALRNSVAPTFYSGLSRTIERAPFETGTPSQWMKHLRDTVGARQAEEFEHVGLEGRLGPLAEVKAPVERKAQAALETWKAANKGQRPPKELTDAASNENKRIVEQRLAEKGNEQPLTKAELLAHVASNQPKFKEIVKSEADKDWEERIHSRAQQIMEEEHPGIGPAHPRFHDFFARSTHKAEDALIAEGGGDAKYSDYQLPGGTNYREHLMTMPVDKKPIPEGLKDKADAVIKKAGKGIPNWGASIDNAGSGWNPRTSSETWLKEGKITKQDFDTLKDYLDRDSFNSRTGQNADYYSSHWDEPNVIVHTRMNDRDLGGVKSLHAEEFQSDLHQEGRKKGYKNNELEPKAKKLQQEYMNILPVMHDLVAKNNNFGYRDMPEAMAKMRQLGPDVAFPNASAADKVVAWKTYDKFNEANEAAQKNKGSVPDFPFKKSWPDLAIKRWLRQAVDNDYDAVSWTPGEAQRDRFQLAHHIEQLHYEKMPDDTYLLAPVNREGREVPINRGLPVKESELSRYLGDAVAEKVRKGEGKRDKTDSITTLENADLKVGGEGLVSFYDKTIKGKVEALVEKFGGKVEKHKINDTQEVTQAREMKKKIDSLWEKLTDANEMSKLSHREYKDLVAKREELIREYVKLNKNGNEAGFVWSVKLTPETKRAIRSEGFPLFTAGPVMTPVDHDPFDKKQKPKPKLEPVEHDPFAQPTPDLGGVLNKLISAAGGYRPRPRPIQNGFGRRQ